MRGRWYQNGRGRTHLAHEWGRFRGISRGGGLHTTDTRAPALPDAGEPNCVRTMNHVYARAFARGEGRGRDRGREGGRHRCAIHFGHDVTPGIPGGRIQAWAYLCATRKVWLGYRAN